MTATNYKVSLEPDIFSYSVVNLIIFSHFVFFQIDIPCAQTVTYSQSNVNELFRLKLVKSFKAN